LSILNCRYYGFECNFEIKGDIKKIVNKMQQHAIVEHKVDLTKEFLSQMILRKIS
jgi:predicted small metal-binding protein